MIVGLNLGRQLRDRLSRLIQQQATICRSTCIRSNDRLGGMMNVHTVFNTAVRYEIWNERLGEDTRYFLATA